MKRNERHPDQGVEARAIASTTLNLSYNPNQWEGYSYSTMELSVLKMNEDGLKIGRRFSFDDNGGSYQGL
jgi:hypothetical protein